MFGGYSTSTQVCGRVFLYIRWGMVSLSPKIWYLLVSFCTSQRGYIEAKTCETTGGWTSMDSRCENLDTQVLISPSVKGTNVYWVYFFFNPFKATPFWDMLDLMYRLIFETYWSKSGDGGDGQAYSGPWEWGQVWLHKVRGELRLLRDLFSLGDVIQVDIDKAGPPSCSSSGHRILPRQQYPTIITWSIKTSQPYPKCFRTYSKQRYGRSLRRSQALSLLHVADNLERAIDSVKTDHLDESEARGLRSWGYSWNIR